MGIQQFSDAQRWYCATEAAAEPVGTQMNPPDDELLTAMLASGLEQVAAEADQDLSKATALAVVARAMRQQETPQDGDS
jgi:hypothetical protein